MGNDRFPWPRVLALIGVGAASIAGAIGATDPHNWWVTPLLVLGILCIAGAVVDSSLWLVRRTRDAKSVQREAPSILMRPKYATKEEHRAHRAAEEKRARGQRLSRDERRLLERPEFGTTNASILEYLGRQLELGQMHLDPIRWAGEGFQRKMAEFAGTNPDKPTVEAWLEEYFPGNSIDEAHQWRQSVNEALSKNLNYSFVARFDSDAGLTPAPLPPGLTDGYYAKAWQAHEMRLQRLHQIIEELTDKWSK